jgi:multimeric flavodoxin WrbA
MKTLLIVYHSRTGGTQQMAAAAAHAAAADDDVEVRLLAATDANAADVLDADGYIFAAPENLAALSGVMKDFFDRTYYPVLDRINGRPCAMLVCAGSDGDNAVRQMKRIVTGWRLRIVADPVIVNTHAQTAESILKTKRIDAGDLARCEAIGATLAAGMAAGVF